jgi:hypothetical protein
MQRGTAGTDTGSRQASRRSLVLPRPTLANGPEARRLQDVNPWCPELEHPCPFANDRIASPGIPEPVVHASTPSTRAKRRQAPRTAHERQSIENNGRTTGDRSCTRVRLKVRLVEPYCWAVYCRSHMHTREECSGEPVAMRPTTNRLFSETNDDLPKRSAMQRPAVTLRVARRGAGARFGHRWPARDG